MANTEKGRFCTCNVLVGLLCIPLSFLNIQAIRGIWFAVIFLVLKRKKQNIHSSNWKLSPECSWSQDWLGVFRLSMFPEQTAFFPITLNGLNYHIFWELQCCVPLNNIGKTVLIWKVYCAYSVKAVHPLVCWDGGHQVSPRPVPPPGDLAVLDTGKCGVYLPQTVFTVDLWVLTVLEPQPRDRTATAQPRIWKVSCKAFKHVWLKQGSIVIETETCSQKVCLLTKK